MVLSLVLSLFVGMNSVAHAAEDAVADYAQPCAVTYQYENFGGAYLPFDAGSYINNLSRYEFNNRISSVTVNPGCTLTMFQYYNFEGHSQSYRSGDHAYLGSFHNIPSSLICTCSHYR